jgi:opacity protein-like surface antigen
MKTAPPGQSFFLLSSARRITDHLYFMKKLLLAIILVSISLGAWAQIPRGTSTIGGSLSFDHHATKSNKTTTFDIRPGYGLFILNNLCVGINTGLSITRQKPSNKFNGQELNYNSRSIDVGPFVRYYIPINAKLYAFGHASWTRQWSKFEQEIYFPSSDLISFEIKDRSYSWNLGAGLAYFLNPNVALEIMPGYTGYRLKNDDNSQNYIQVEKRGTFALNIGFRLFLRKSN